MATTNTARETFSNASNKTPLSIDQMYQHLVALTKGFPIAVGGLLCYQVDDELRPLAGAAALFAWINHYADVNWRRGGVTKEEFYEGLRQTAETYDWATAHPHFPKIEGVFYTRKRPKAENTGALAELVGRFDPATPVDGELIRALVLTLFWGGPPGKRPTFVITSQEGRDRQKGRGRGKTTLAELLAGLVGGCISVRPHASQDRALTGLLSPTALPLRVALIDNLKTYRLSSDFIEALITCETIDGHRLYHGHATRPNYLTWVITVNGANFSKDMAQRSVVIWLKKFTPSGGWYAETVDFIEENRARIIADVRWHLEQPAKPMARTDRWQVWADAVVSRLDDPDALLAALKPRRAGIDEDDQDAEDTVAHFRAWLRHELAGNSPETALVKIQSLRAVEVIRMLKTNLSDRQAAMYLKQLGHPRLRYYREGKERGYLWVGEDADQTLAPTVKLYETRSDR